ARPRPGASANGAVRRPPRPATRRSRNPTTSLAATPFRSTIVAPGVVPDVQPQLNGVPDPVLAPATAPAPSPGALGLRRRIAEEDPYAPLGIRLGGTTLFPTLGQSIGYDTNPNRTQSRRGSFVSQTEGELAVQTDWSRHALTGSLRGAYNEYPSVPEASRPEGAGRLGLRLDIDRDTQVNIDGRFAVDTQRPDSPELGTAVQTRPLVFSEGATAGVTHRFNRLVASLQGTIDRTDFEDARTSSGTVLDQSDRNMTQYGVRARLGYELTPGLIPFVEGLADTRVYDRRVDNAGFARDSNGLGGRAGTTFELTRLVTGEIAAGAIQRRYDDPRLGNLTSPLLDASLSWAVTPLTTVRATAAATVDETTVVGSNGVRVLRGALEVSHALRRNLIVTGGLTATDYDYSGVAITETGFGALLRADYKFTRWLGLRASYNYERLHSSLAGASYSTNVFLLGMRFTP
ncbi:MAG: hypothetical protein JWR08_1439, partial [Enterovirga sp.]|nr:hypothetical protein [Enterovirga sp.]